MPHRRRCRRPRVVDPVEPLPGYDPNFDVYCSESLGCVAGAPWAVETPVLTTLSPVQEYWYRMATLGPYVLPYPGCPGYGYPYSPCGGYRGSGCGPYSPLGQYGPFSPSAPYGYGHGHGCGCHSHHHDKPHCPDCNVKVFINQDGTTTTEPPAE